ncbi:hypothetical protein IFM89_020045 [Coptis chinensis]|uniref:Uncharacterized protein n=1 Tax=Coptis chinensis TaxID=261450 RepID=A0A835MA49_9MAGN|nr:hypothetical protein IFM89_020045 [Coptis chinensis]
MGILLFSWESFVKTCRRAKKEYLIARWAPKVGLTKDIWSAAAIACLVHIWKTRNRDLYDGGKVKKGQVRIHIKRAILRPHEFSGGTMDNTPLKLEALHALGLRNKLRRAPKILECYWIAPSPEYLKINVNGCARGNPGPTGWETLFRKHTGGVFTLGE